jgi:hypothetical protein
MANQGLAQPWLQRVSRPKIQRGLEAEEWQAHEGDDRWDVLLKAPNSSLKVSLILRPSVSGFEFLKLPDGRVLKAEQKVTHNWPNDPKQWRSVRLFPFALNAVTELELRVGEWTRVLQKRDGSWQTTNPVHPGWEGFFKRFQRLACLGFIDDFERQAEALAHYEIAFESGDLSLLELFQTERGEWVVAYRGQDMAHVLTQEQKQHLFPEWPQDAVD